MPFIKANLGGTVISASKQPCDVNVEGQYQANNEQWVKQGPSYVQPTTVPGALRFIIEMRGFMVQLGFDAVDLHTTPA